MYNDELIRTLSILMIFTSVVAIEVRNLKVATYSYMFQAIMIVALLFAYSVGNSALIYWGITALVTKAILTPMLLLMAIRKTGQEECPSIVGVVPSLIISLIIVVIFYNLMMDHLNFMAPTYGAKHLVFRVNLAMGFTVFTLGLYGILTRRDALKTVIGLCLLENGIHLSLVSLAPTMRETALAGIASEVVITVAMLLYIIVGIHEKFGSRDTFQLSELHW